MTSPARQRILLSALAVAVAAAAVLFWPTGAGRIQADPPLSAEALAATPDARLIFVAATEVRWYLSGDADRMAAWRQLDEVPRTVLALSWVETGESDPRKSVFRGFGSFLAVEAPNRPTPDDLAVAYEVIGAPDVAGVCRQVQELSESGTIGDSGRLAGLDGEFLRARDAAGTVAKLNAYILSLIHI